VDTPRPSPRTSRTRRVPHPVLIGHSAARSQAIEWDEEWKAAHAAGSMLDQSGRAVKGVHDDHKQAW
jgi:hypothetical protein